MGGNKVTRGYTCSRNCVKKTMKNAGCVALRTMWLARVTRINSLPPFNTYMYCIPSNLALQFVFNAQILAFFD